MYSPNMIIVEVSKEHFLEPISYFTRPAQHCPSPRWHGYEWRDKRSGEALKVWHIVELQTGVRSRSRTFYLRLRLRLKSGGFHLTFHLSVTKIASSAEQKREKNHAWNITKDNCFNQNTFFSQTDLIWKRKQRFVWTSCQTFRQTVFPL